MGERIKLTLDPLDANHIHLYALGTEGREYLSATMHVDCLSDLIGRDQYEPLMRQLKASKAGIFCTLTIE